ncbi:hypothetical protein [Salinibacterium sp.]|uniref:hypothetical protein n=1 Tax=Salinibacterium sp. TaxID=1915057 RepID=UPI00286C4D9D|nr:hypothetical protein [Salinibacterium sp.]
MDPLLFATNSEIALTRRGQDQQTQVLLARLPKMGDRILVRRHLSGKFLVPARHFGSVSIPLSLLFVPTPCFGPNYLFTLPLGALPGAFR